MTTDAKIGLLLALIFIVAITFVINGLPAFLSKNNKEADTASYLSHYKEQQPALVGASRNIATVLSHKPDMPVITETPKIDLNSPAETRYQALMPAAQEAVKTTETVDTNTMQKEPVAIKPPEKTADQQESVITYVVAPGDNLAEIAQKMYGPEIGKKPASIQKIFNANKDKLSSINAIQVGQKLVIPPLEDKTNTLLKTGLFERVSEKVSKITSPQTAQVSNQSSKEQYRQYVVKESDSLWQIAQVQLGNGNRFSEIIQLNQSVLSDPEKLEVGMKLKLPAR
ncbi:MAG: LysM peptidoglycan-binding domain-containing protein [Sedimentisphaerales bacterium]